MTTVARRDFRSIPYRDASATWSAIVDLLTGGGKDLAKKLELMKVSGVASSVIADQISRDCPIVVTCDGPRTRVYCCYDEDALDDSSGNEARLGYDALNGDWQVSLPVAEEDLVWIRGALRKNSSRVVARNMDAGLEVEASAQAAPGSALVLDVEGFMKL